MQHADILSSAIVKLLALQRRLWALPLMRLMLRSRTPKGTDRSHPQRTSADFGPLRRDRLMV